MKSLLIVGWIIAGTVGLYAQAVLPPNSSGTPAPAPAPAPATAPSTSFSPNEPSRLGNDLPGFDAGLDVVNWDGKSWNINNQRLFRARLEKFLNAPEQSGQDFQAYQAIILEIMDKLSPEHYKPSNLDEAWGLLRKASNYGIDAHLCDALADAIYSTWLASNERSRMDNAMKTLDRQRSDLQWDQQRAAEDTIDISPGASGNDKATSAIVAEDKKIARDAKMQPYIQRLAEVNAMMVANQTKQEASLLQAKIEFQSLLIQLFFQRRFQHVAMGTRFYRFLFGDGDTALHIDKSSGFAQGAPLPPTLGVLDSLSDEAMRDVKEGVDAFLFLVEKKELASASERLAETFAIGEYMPEIRNIPRDKKRQSLLFFQKQNQLLSAIDVKDYSLAERLTAEIMDMASDFDNSKPLAAVQTAKTVSSMHLAKAKTAAVSGDRGTLETELKAATEIWPRNPELAQVSNSIFSQANVQQQALSDLDRLVSQHNLRQIYDDRVRYIAATALYPDRQVQLGMILQQMQTIEGVIIRSTEIEKRGDFAGAWEGVEKIVDQYPDDPKLNQLRAQLTTEAPDFVRSIRTAESLEKKQEIGASLAWYLKSQVLYPSSDFAQQGIDRLVKQILPE